MRLDVRHRLKPPSSPANLLTRHVWKLGLGVVVVLLLTARGAGPSYTHPRGLATSVIATSVPCGDIKLDNGSTDTATWTASSSPYGTGSPYILPHNDPNLPTNDPSNPNCLTVGNAPDELHVPAGVKLVIDGSQGPVQIFSHGTGIYVNGGQLKTVSTDSTNTVVFDAEPDVASWDGINVSAADAANRGNASLSFVSIQHALTAITITSGATSSPDNASYGLTVRNSGIGPSYFNGIDATNTPILVSGRVDPLTSRPDGQFGTLNNIGSRGIKVMYDPGLPNYPSVIPDKALDVENMTFGSSVPFGETTCVPLQPCAAGSIGNDAILGNFVTGQQPIKLDNNSFFRAGNYGLDLTNANNPTITNNIFTCNGSGSPKPVITCVGTDLRYPAIYLASVTNLSFGAGGINNNSGQQNGLDAIGLNGQVVSDLAWQTPTNDANAPSLLHPPHALGYVIANGDLQLVNSKLTVKDGDVVKVKGGAILITNGSLDASGPSLKTFTSLRDNTVGLPACPSVLVQSCPSPLPANEWIGIDLVGSTGNIVNANILFPTKAIDISGGQASLSGPDGGAYGLIVGNSRIGPTFSDSVAVNATPVYISASKFCRIDTIPSDAAYLQCTGAGPGDHGINASYTGTPRPAAGGGLKLLGNDFQGSTNEAILGTALSARLVDIENNTVETAGTYGMHLVAADNLTLQGNAVTGSGTGNLANATTYAAIYLDGISKADFSGPISANTGAGNGLDAIAFHGSTADLKPLNWKTIGAAGGALGYLVDGDLAVNGDLTLAANDYAPVLGGAITMHNGTFTATGATLSSLKEQAPHLPSCGSVFVPKVSGVCPVTAPGDWTGLIFDPGKANVLTDSEIRYAVTGISVGMPTGSRTAENLTMIRSNVRNTAADGVATLSPLSITDGAFTGNAGRGIKVDLTGVTPSATQPLIINGHATIAGSGQDGILAIKLAGHTVQITGASVDRAGAFGIKLGDADHLTLTNNTVTNSAATYPAIYLNGFTGPFGTIVTPYVFGNKGAGNGIDAIALHGTVTDSLIWQTARKTADPTQLLGYVLDNTLNMQPGQTLTVGAGDIVKVGNGGMLNLQGVTLRADGTESSAQKIFTSLTDNSAGVVACPSVLLPGCQPAAPGDWAGISLSGSLANGALVNASLRYATTAINITNGATSTSGSSSFGLVVSRSTLASTRTDGIAATNTAISVTDSTIGGGVHGANVTLTSDPTTPAAVRLSGNRFTSQSAEAIVGQGLFGQSVWITDNRVQNAGTFGIRLVGSDGLVLRNNNISGSGGGPNAGAAGYPAAYLNGVSADFTSNVRGNVGSGNGLDVIAFHGTANGDLSWQTPTVNANTAALGYVLDGSLAVNGGTLTVHPGDVVKSLGGPITISGGTLDASNDSDPRPKLFTSLKDQTAFAQTCPSILTGLCASGAQQGDWGGIVITDDTSGRPGSASIANGQLSFAATALTVNSGPTASFGTTNLGLIVKGTTISDATSDGINAQDTPISVTASTIERVGLHGILATFFGGTPCVSACGTSLDVEHVTITKTAKDGIVASGLGGRHTVISDNVITGAGTYGIRLAGADQLTLNRNTVNNSGGPATTFRYPAMYLSGVKADFELAPGTTTVAGNHGSGNGLDAIVIHGEASQALTWLTTGVAAPVVVPTVPVDHFGYMLDGGLTVDGALTTNIGDVVKVLGGLIQVNGSLQATGTAFTSLKDGAVSIKVCDAGYDTVFLQKASGSCPAAASGDWAGINATAASTLTNSTIGFDDGLTVTGGALQFVGGLMHDIARNAIVVTGSPLSVTNVIFSRIGNDAIDSTNSGSMDTITDDQFDHVGGVAINLQNAQADMERNVFTNDASPAVKTSGAPVTLQCSSIQSGGVSGDAGLVVKENDFVPGVGVAAPAGASAENNWWGQTTGPSGQLSGGLAVTNYFTTQNPTATIATTGKPSTTQPLDPVRSDGSLGTGLVQATLTFSRNMNPEAALPLVSYASSPVDLTGAWKLNDPRTWTGTAPIDSTLATTGTHTVSASGAHDCVPDLLHNVMTAASTTFAVDTTTLPLVTVNAPADLIGAHGARLHGRIDPNGWATGAVQSGQFVVTNLANPLDQHTYATPPVADKTTPLAFTLTISGLSPSSTYGYQLEVPGPNGVASQTTLDTLTTTDVASKVVFTSSPPASIQAGATFSATATTQDASGNVVSDFTGTVSVALTAAGGATLSGTLTQPVVHGVASFTDLSVDRTGSYTLTPTASPLLTALLSSSFTITPGPLDHLVLSPAGASITAGDSQAYTAEGQDAYDNSLGDVTSATNFAITPDGSCTGASCTATIADGASTHHTVTGTDSAKTGIASLTVNAAALDHLVLSPASATITAGGSQSFTAQGQDAYNNSLGDITSATNFAITPDGSCTGASCTATVADGASTHHTVTGTDSGKTADASLTVNAAALDHLVLSPSSASITAGGSQAYTAQGQDAYNNDLGDVTATTVFSLDDLSGSCTGTSCTETKAGSHTVMGTDGAKTGIAGLTVNAAALDHLLLSPASVAITAGGSQAYTAEGQDTYNNSLGDVTSATNFAITPDGSCIGASCAATIADGPSTHHTVTGTDSGKTGIASLTINPAATSQVVFSALATTASVNVATTFTLTAEDAYGNTTPSYVGQVQFTSTDVTAVLPSDYTFAALDNGIHAGFSITFNTAGSWTISAGDTAGGSTIGGTSASVTVS